MYICYLYLQSCSTKHWELVNKLRGLILNTVCTLNTPAEKEIINIY